MEVMYEHKQVGVVIGAKAARIYGYRWMMRPEPVMVWVVYTMYKSIRMDGVEKVKR
jgi:hypothetical protein